ncbi:BolA family protein [Pseudoroseicyclus tamaricis]|uniref:BolA family transcriptional regulator n=1 Tax=Pseudoroseicyclus tamaricis TaxID=2705421 RepID=A0A6B2JJG4_9RHOB|nr:BolA family protein [Pseudoroseicyclus tamaricis]NDV01581.1 BolA family transcriptional regulator [Pseudoroseicyclus tamaricis]
MAMADEMETRLRGAFTPTRLEIVNESAHHAGHAGDDGSGESHWRVVLAAPELEGMSRLQRHRAVHAALGPEVMGRIHALALDLS